MAATGAKWGKKGMDAADDFADATRNAPSYPTTAKPFVELAEADRLAVARWRDELPTKPTPTGKPSGRYEVEQTGPWNYTMGKGDDAIDADGVRDLDATVLDAKHVGSPDRSPYVPRSSVPDVVRAKINGEFEGELKRYAKVVHDADNPMRALEIVTNDPRAVPYFEEVLSKYDFSSRVTVRGDAP